MNKLPIFIDKKIFYSSKKTNLNISQYPCFLLIAGDWDDYCYRTTFNLYYYKTINDKLPIGEVKIGTIKKIEPYDPEKGFSQFWVLSVMDDIYYDGLPKEFFSLGQKMEYYYEIKRQFPNDFDAVFESLRDCAMCSSIAEDCEDISMFHTSLERDQSAAACLFEAQSRLQGENQNKLYSFGFKFVPNECEPENYCKLDFDFKEDSELPRRCFALIGENGVGKTTLLSKLPIELKNVRKKKNVDRFTKVPIFSKIITVSHSYYDDFEYPEKSDLFNYVYCGLMDKNDNGEKILSTKDSIYEKIISSFEKIQQRKRTWLWSKYVEMLFSEKYFEPDELERQDKFEVDVLKAKIKKNSSGQNAVLFVLTNIIANIRHGSFLIVDEPEIHLHPRAIALFVKVLYKILDHFSSYCVIATHSPLVVREMTSDAVFIMERNDDTPSIRTLENETLGENVSILTNEIFDLIDVEPYFKEQIRKLRKDKSKEQIVDMIQGNLQNPLNFNLRMFISGLYKDHAESEKN